VVQGGGQSAGALDLSNPAQYGGQAIDSKQEGRTGIWAPHFEKFLEVAREDNCAIIVRVTKAACVPWIAKRYPAKPSSVWKIKNSPRTGLVTCSDRHPQFSYQEQVEHAWEAGYYVLEEPVRASRPGPSPPCGITATPTLEDGTTFGKIPAPLNGPEASNHLVARRRQHVLDVQFPKERFEVGQVIDPARLLPLTGDYDLMSVFPVDNAGGKNLVLVHSDADSAKKVEEVAPGVWLRKQRTNPYVTGIANKLNRKFGDERIMHGAHELKYDPDENNTDGCTVFSPAGAFFLPTADSVNAFIEKIGRLATLPRPERSLGG
jgi:hypothetical protein